MKDNKPQFVPTIKKNISEGQLKAFILEEIKEVLIYINLAKPNRFNVLYICWIQKAINRIEENIITKCSIFNIDSTKLSEAINNNHIRRITSIENSDRILYTGINSDKNSCPEDWKAIENIKQELQQIRDLLEREIKLPQEKEITSEGQQILKKIQTIAERMQKMSCFTKGDIDKLAKVDGLLKEIIERREQIHGL